MENQNNKELESYLDKYFGVSIKEQWNRWHKVSNKFWGSLFVSLSVMLIGLYMPKIELQLFFIVLSFIVALLGFLYISVEYFVAFYLSNKIEKQGSSPQEIKRLLTEYRGLIHPDLYKYYRNLYRQWIIEDIKQMLDL